ncbi:zinc-binding dehydrogenase [Kribbella voronezhensis]|uniref:zinc-binding dehydrogenase n=1 Tax=Kribbella voronezhensis TaxID=2512212 RepID=UPI00192DFCDD|nr:zinc-binding dehydrogenase [Kribbella voronezhensis]
MDPDDAGLTDLVRRGQLIVHVSKEFPLAEAHHLVAQGRTAGKVVLNVSEEGVV